MKADLTLKQIGLSDQACSILMKNQIFTLSDLINTKYYDLYKMPRLSKKLFDEIISRMEEFGATPDKTGYGLLMMPTAVQGKNLQTDLLNYEKIYKIQREEYLNLYYENKWNNDELAVNYILKAIEYGATPEKHYLADINFYGSESYNPNYKEARKWLLEYLSDVYFAADYNDIFWVLYKLGVCSIIELEHSNESPELNEKLKEALSYWKKILDYKGYIYSESIDTYGSKHFGIKEMFLFIIDTLLIGTFTYNKIVVNIGIQETLLKDFILFAIKRDVPGSVLKLARCHLLGVGYLKNVDKAEAILFNEAKFHLTHRSLQYEDELGEIERYFMDNYFSKIQWNEAQKYFGKTIEVDGKVINIKKLYEMSYTDCIIEYENWSSLKSIFTTLSNYIDAEQKKRWLIENSIRGLDTLIEIARENESVLSVNDLYYVINQTSIKYTNEIPVDDEIIKSIVHYLLKNGIQVGTNEPAFNQLIYTELIDYAKEHGNCINLSEIEKWFEQTIPNRQDIIREMCVKLLNNNIKVIT